MSYRNIQKQNSFTRASNNSCGCNKPLAINKTKMVDPPPCSSNVTTKTWPYQIGKPLGVIDLSNEREIFTRDLPAKVANAYLLQMTMKKRPDYGINLRNVIEAMPKFYITDGSREIIPESWSKDDYYEYLISMGYNMVIQQPQKRRDLDDGGQIIRDGEGDDPKFNGDDEGSQTVRFIVPIIFGRKYASGSLAGFIDRDCAFAPEYKPILHIVNDGRTDMLFDRKMELITVGCNQKPTFEKTFTKKETVTLESTGVTCINLPNDGCLEAILMEPAVTYADGVKDKEVTIEEMEFIQNDKPIMNVDGLIGFDFQELLSEKDLLNTHRYVIKFDVDEYCCGGECLGLDCTSKMKIKCGIHGGDSRMRNLTYSCILIKPAYQGTPCCC